uniref:Tetratricopeptide repeat protein n=1 Tax=Timema bartmani TaxID=61472 RepID=A0A7R9ERB6_9NEOP|nr:unnamed protein product [Timema bartmani]
MIGKIKEVKGEKMVEAKRVLTNILRIWPQNGFAMAHYGFVLKVGDNNIEKSVGFLRHGIASREPGTLDGRFFFQLGDALMRLGRGNEALEELHIVSQEASQNIRPIGDNSFDEGITGEDQMNLS